jgi:hypothetical protein
MDQPRAAREAQQPEDGSHRFLHLRPNSLRFSRSSLHSAEQGFIVLAHGHQAGKSAVRARLRTQETRHESPAARPHSGARLAGKETPVDLRRSGPFLEGFVAREVIWQGCQRTAQLRRHRARAFAAIQDSITATKRTQSQVSTRSGAVRVLNRRIICAVPAPTG